MMDAVDIDAEGFIRILGLPARTRAIIHAEAPSVESLGSKEAVK